MREFDIEINEMDTVKIASVDSVEKGMIFEAFDSKEHDCIIRGIMFNEAHRICQ